MKAISLVPFEYILESEKEEDKPTKFDLRPMNGLEEMERQDYVYGINPNIKKAFIFVVESCLLGWTDFYDSEGKAIEFNKSNKSENLKLLTASVITELNQEIMSASALDGEQKKS